MALIVRTCFFALLLYLAASGINVKRKIDLEGFLLRRIEGVKDYRYFRKIDVLIKSSAVKKVLPFINLYSYLFITFLIVFCSLISSYLLTRSIIPALGIAFIAGSMPTMVLELMRVVNIRRVRSNYHGFLCSLIGYYALSKDIVGSFNNAADYTGEPLNSYVKDAVYKYNKSNVNFDVCLDELEDRTGERELSKLIKFTKLHLLYGGDYTKILNKLNTHSQRVEKARMSFYSSAYVGIIAISVTGMVVVATFISIFSNERAASIVLSTTLMGNCFLLFNIISVFFAIYMAFRLFRGDV